MAEPVEYEELRFIKMVRAISVETEGSLGARMEFRHPELEITAGMNMKDAARLWKASAEQGPIQATLILKVRKSHD